MNASSATKPVIGIAGGVGAGKSTVAAELARLGCLVIDADALGHELLGSADVRDALRRRWGGDIFDAAGTVRRERLAEIVFGDPAALAELNRLLHPRMRQEIKARIGRGQADPACPAVVLDAAVLFEAGWDDLCTHLVFVETPDELRARRVEQQRGWDEPTWRRREKSQLPLDRKAAGCLYCVRNSSDVSHLRNEVRNLLHQIVQAAG